MKLTFGMPLWLMKEYLRELSATEVADNVFVCDGWQAVVTKSEPVKVGSLVVGRIEVDVSGDEAAIETMLQKLHLKTFRGGG